MRVYVDQTHIGRRRTGLERIADELFSPQTLAPLDVVPVTASGLGSMMLVQTFGLPARLAVSPGAIVVCPGFPPSPLLLAFGQRAIPYVHDVFLLTRRSDLNIKAKLYMAQPFAWAVRRLRRFFVNSEDTRRRLRAMCHPDAEVDLYRPVVRDVFGLAPVRRDVVRPARDLRLVAIGSVEPRKNLVAAADIVAALRRRGFVGARLDVIGRRGWGGDWDRLAAMPWVVLHGYVPEGDVADIVATADLVINTSHAEGLGLPLLEVQHGGLQVVAPDSAISREVLGDSAILIDPNDHDTAAVMIAQRVAAADWRTESAAKARANLLRWNRAAALDRDCVVSRLCDLVAHGTSRRRLAAHRRGGF